MPKTKKPPKVIDPMFYSVPMAAAYLNLGKEVTHKLMVEDHIESCYCGSQLRTSKEKLDEALKGWVTGTKEVPGLIYKIK